MPPGYPERRKSGGNRVQMPALLVGLAIGAAAGFFVGRGPSHVGTAQAWSDITGLYEQDRISLLKRDVASQELLIPEDFALTDTAGNLLRKPQVVERMRANPALYSEYQQSLEDFRLFGDVVVMNVKERGVPMTDRNVPQSQPPIDRRFTDVWVHRRGKWEKIVRHESVIPSSR